ncbi:MAG: hypothetical protein M0036_14785 [Desulfobacteraceae bacterium]|nr:hypothetical protein [Desulfobacteraceae bacterium]
MSDGKGYVNLLHPLMWQQLSLNQRVGVLQQLENDYAGRQGRGPYQIEPDHTKNVGSCGCADHRQNKIFVNAEHIRNDACLFLTVHTVLHEGRHAYQQAAIDHDGLHPKKDEVELWRKNHSVYIPSTEKSFVLYRNQPLERDAEAYANAEMGGLYDQLQEKYGSSEVYQKYVAIAAQEARYVEKAVIQRWGPNYAADIDKAIGEAYELKHGFNASKTYRISVKFEGAEWTSKMVSMDPAAKVHLQQNLTAEARNFMLREANRMGISPEGIKGAQTKIDGIPMEQQHTKGRSIERGRGLG